jgi:predicted aconitase with swiveling domain
MIISNCKKIVGGRGEGFVLLTKQPINFLSMIDAKTGKIIDPTHELYNKSLIKTILVYPYAIGSSVGAYTIYALKYYRNAPSAIICSKIDITTASGCAIANIPVVNLPDDTIISAISPGSRAIVEADRGRVITDV